MENPTKEEQPSPYTVAALDKGGVVIIIKKNEKKEDNIVITLPTTESASALAAQILAAAYRVSVPVSQPKVEELTKN
jgi:hypothetical protein